MKNLEMTTNSTFERPTFKLAALTLSLMGLLFGTAGAAEHLTMDQENFNIIVDRVDFNKQSIEGAIGKIDAVQNQVNGIGDSVNILVGRIDDNFNVLSKDINNAQDTARAQLEAAQDAMNIKLNDAQAVLNDNLNKAQKQLSDNINNTNTTFHGRCDDLEKRKADKFTIVGEDDIVVTHDETDNSYHISMNNGPNGLVGQVDQNTARIDDLDRDMKKTGAMAAAMAALKPLEYDENRKFAASAGLGHYHGNQALAVGLFYHPTRNMLFNAGLSSTGGSDTMVNAGITMSLGKRQANTMKEAMLEDEVKVLRRQVSELREAVAELTRVAR